VSEEKCPRVERSSDGAWFVAWERLSRTIMPDHVTAVGCAAWREMEELLKEDLEPMSLSYDEKHEWLRRKDALLKRLEDAR